MGKTGGLRARRNKFNAVKVKLDGYVFDSKAEARRYGELKLLQKAGEIYDLKIHPTYDLEVHGELVATYKPDFKYYRSLGSSILFVNVCDPLVVEDVKSPPTAKKRDFVLIRKLMHAIHGIDVEIVS